MKYVKISSTIEITVTSGLQYEDHTNKDAHIPDRLKVAARWPKCNFALHVGVNYCPIEIKNWRTVQALAKQNIITIGEEVDEIPAQYSDDEVRAEKVTRSINEMKSQQGRIKGLNLADIAED